MTGSTGASTASRWGIGVLALALLLVGATFRPAAAQDATPAATPAPGGVPCTDLFGIVEGNACVIVVHASPDAGFVDVYVDGGLVFAGVQFGALGDYVPVPAGERQIQVTPSGADLTQAAIDVTVDLEEAVAYEVAVLGLLAELEVRAFPVDTNVLEGVTARARVIHASPDAPAVDVAVTGGNVLIDDLAFLEASEYVELPAAVYDLEARATGTEDVALPLPGTVLNANFVYSIYLIGQVADGTLTVMVVPVLISPDIAGALEATPEA